MMRGVKRKAQEMKVAVKQIQEMKRWGTMGNKIVVHQSH